MQLLNVGFRVLQFFTALALPFLWALAIREFVVAMKVCLTREEE